MLSPYEIFKEVGNELQSKDDFELFVRDVLHLGAEVIGPRQLLWPGQAMESKRFIKIAPREHGKSVTMAQAYPAWRLWQDPNIKIIIASETEGQAKKMLLGVKNFIEMQDSPLNALHPGREGKWDQTNIIVKRDTTEPHPSIMAVGVGASQLGSRADVIICDDIAGIKNSLTPEQREKLKEWYLKVLFPMLGPDGEIVILGTFWHIDDIYHALKANPKYTYDDTEKDAIINEATQEVMWPELWSYDALMERKEDIGSLSFAHSYRNDLTKYKDGFFKDEWFQFDIPLSQDPQGWDMVHLKEVYMGVDLSTGIEGGDYFAVVVSGIDNRDNTIHILETYHDRLEFPEQVEKIKRIAKRWGGYTDYRLKHINIEKTAYQVSMVQHLKRSSMLPVVGVPAEGDKKPESSKNRFLRLTPLFESGRVFMKESMNDLQLELLQCPHGSHDDLLDALFYSLRDVVSVRERGWKGRVF